ncbi:purine catabolism regulator [Antricoccus suffuscus]|uniref:Purine catabolism regulator n=1 Tax=Antricoccus suffuscus TaxID=1629062 RepID=A0A2T0ZVU9_9ACTN|nr:PucR family transcriptional regulator [Antricoccus suffuscus]PRZ40377.1 purine catabolism regulator [Antricoccus suffuscus]
MASMQGGLSVRDVLRVGSLSDARVVAGWDGLDRIVQRMNVMEVPDVLPWVKAGELLLTTGYPLREDPESLTELVKDLDRRGLAGLAIKLGRYIDELPESTLLAAAERDFPVILVGNQFGFDDIMNEVLTEVLHNQTVATARSEEVHQALLGIVLAGGGLSEVGQKAATLLATTVMIEDQAGRVESAATPAGECTADELERLGALRGSEHIAVPIVAGGARLGTIRALPEDGARMVPAYPDMTTVLERLSTVAALVIIRQQAVAGVEARYKADLVRDLIEGRKLEVSRVHSQAHGFGWDLRRDLVVCMIEYDVTGPAAKTAPTLESLDQLADTWRKALREYDEPAACVAASGGAVALVGAHLTREQLADAAARATRTLKSAGRASRIGVSRAIREVAEIPSGFSQARRSLAVSRQFDHRDEVTYFDDLGVYRLLSLIPDGAELRDYVTEVLGPLANDDSDDAADLRETLLVLLETNLNVAKSARLLHFHYNTLRYRIGKLERLVGPFSQDANLRLNLLLALHVLHLRAV